MTNSDRARLAEFSGGTSVGVVDPSNGALLWLKWKFKDSPDIRQSDFAPDKDGNHMLLLLEALVEKTGDAVRIEIAFLESGVLYRVWLATGPLKVDSTGKDLPTAVCDAALSVMESQPAADKKGNKSDNQPQKNVNEVIADIRTSKPFASSCWD